MNIIIKKFKYRFKPINKVRNIRLKKQKLSTFKIIILITVIISTISIMIYKNIEPILSEMAISKIQAIITVISNEAVLEVINDNDTYSHITMNEKNENGEIISVKTDVITTNKLKSEIVLKVQNKISSMEKITVFLPIDVLFGINILSGYGFDIPIEIIGINKISANLENEFSSTGINQTRHAIYLNINVNASILAVLHKQNADITTQIPISDTIIVGETPKFYSDNN